MHGKVEGNQFEVLFQKEATRSLICVERIKNTVFTGRGYMSAKAPCDFLLVYQGVAAAIDTKTYDCANMKHSLLEAHQVQSLKNFHNHGLVAGYVVWFRKANKVVFFGADQLASLAEDAALKPEDGQLLGTLEDMNLRSLFDATQPRRGSSDAVSA